MVRELEVEVTNTGDRPIYYLDMILRKTLMQVSACCSRMLMVCAEAAWC